MKKKRKFGIVEILKHDLLDSYPVLYEKAGETVVQFKFTALILPDSTERLNSFSLPHVTSEYSIDSDAEIAAIMAQSIEKPPQEQPQEQQSQTPKKKKPTKKKTKANEEEQMETDE